MKNIKSIIFDQDGTLYNEKNKITHCIRKLSIELISKKLNLNFYDATKIYYDLPEKYPNPFSGFLSLGISISDYHQNVFDVIDISKYLQYDFRLVKLFHDLKAFDKYIVTFSSKKYSKELLTRIGIISLIKKSYFVHDEINVSKKTCYEKIMYQKKLVSAQVCVIGNNYDTDIIPAKELGLNVILVTTLLKNTNEILCIESIYDLLKYLSAD